MADPQIMADFFNLDFSALDQEKYKAIIIKVFQGVPLPVVKRDISQLLWYENFCPILYHSQKEMVTGWNMDELCAAALECENVISNCQRSLKGTLLLIKNLKKRNEMYSFEYQTSETKKWLPQKELVYKRPKSTFQEKLATSISSFQDCADGGGEHPDMEIHPRWNFATHLIVPQLKAYFAKLFVSGTLLRVFECCRCKQFRVGGNDRAENCRDPDCQRLKNEVSNAREEVKKMKRDYAKREKGNRSRDRNRWSRS